MVLSDMVRGCVRGCVEELCDCFLTGKGAGPAASDQ